MSSKDVNVSTAAHASSTSNAVQSFGSGDCLGMLHAYDDSHLFSSTPPSTGTYFVFPLGKLMTNFAWLL